MPDCDLHLRNVRVFDGSGAEPELMEVAICSDRISDVGHGLPCRAAKTLDANGLALAPGFIDVHTHDDIAVLRAPEMLPKISQGVTTVIVGNCGISLCLAGYVAW